MTHPLQTREWGEFRKEWGNEIIFEKDNLIIFSKIPHTKFTIGTVMKGSNIARSNLATIRKVAQENNSIFIKFEPNSTKATLGTAKFNKLIDNFKKWGFVKGKPLFTPTTFWIDLLRPEEDILKSFSSKTRYNIRLAQKHGVKVQIDNSDIAFEKYLELTTETNKRQGFYSHTPRYHKLMWKHLKNKIAHLLTATYKGEIVSTWILFAYDGFLYYPYGASTDKYKEIMANNLMMWEAIKFGKKLGCETFDLWGREEGKGFTKFKEGYNPKVVEFIGSWDLVINKPLYYLYRFAEKIRWFILKLR